MKINEKQFRAKNFVYRTFNYIHRANAFYSFDIPEATPPGTDPARLPDRKHGETITRNTHIKENAPGVTLGRLPHGIIALVGIQETVS